jgi:serine/threonine protein kinase
MTLNSIDQFSLIAEGGQSKIYDYDTNKILRVPKKEMDYDRIKYEYQVYRFLENKIPVPHVYDIIEYKNIPCIVMEKINGIDLYSTITTNPLIVFFLPTILSDLHSSLFSLTTSEHFATNHQKSRYCIEKATELLTRQC